MNRSRSSKRKSFLRAPLRWFRKWRERPTTPRPKRRSSFSQYFRFFRGRSSKSLAQSSTRKRTSIFNARALQNPFRKLRILARNTFRWLIGSSQGTAISVANDRAKREKPLVWTNFINPINWVLWPIFFVANFVVSRPYRSLGPALFSIAILLGVGFLFAQQQYQGGKSSRVQQYQRLLTQAVERKDFDTALICSKTLIDLQPNEQRFQIDRAVIEKERGNTEFAYQLMYRLALVRKSGIAAVWLADERFKVDEVKNWTEDDHKLYRGLMLIAVNSLQGVNLDIAKVKLAGYLSAINADAEALKFLQDVVPGNPQYALSAAEMAMKVNDQAKLRTLLPVARNYYESGLKQNPEDLEQRLLLARTLIIEDKLDEAIQILQDGMKLNVNEKYQTALAEALAYKAARLSNQPSTPELVVTRMNLVHSASKLAPNNPVVVESLIEMLIEYRSDENQEIAVLREAAINGLSPEAVHFVRGTISLMDNNLVDARTHLKLAADGGLQLPGILNNLAVAIATSEDGDLQEALSLSNESIEQMPHPYLYETRGQILYKMGKYQECILDLEKGLQAEPLVKGIIPKLADAYRKLGNEQLASEYDERLKRLSNSTPSEPTQVVSPKN